MEKKLELAIVLVVFAMIAVIAVPSVSANYDGNAIYLVPEDSSGMHCEDNTFVEVRVNADVTTHAAQTDIYFDPSCVNITDVNYAGSSWPPLVPPGWMHFDNSVRLVGTNFAGASAGDNLLATIRLHCVGEPGCMSDIEFSNVIVAVMYPDPHDIDITAYNGTFTCGDGEEPDLVVEKSVELDGETFIVSYTVTNIGPGPAGESTTCKYVNGVEMENQTCPALASGESHSGAFAAEDCPCGETLTVTVCADNDKAVDESNEDNNCVDNTVVCPVVDLPELCPNKYRWDSYNWDPFPDTFVGRQEVRFVNTGAGDAFNVVASVTNPPANVVATDPDVTLGDIPAGSSAWSSDSFELRTDMTNPQGPGSRFDWQVEYDDADGVHHVVVNVPMFCVPT